MHPPATPLHPRPPLPHLHACPPTCPPHSPAGAHRLWAGLQLEPARGPWRGPVRAGARLLVRARRGGRSHGARPRLAAAGEAGRACRAGHRAGMHAWLLGAGAAPAARLRHPPPCSPARPRTCRSLRWCWRLTAAHQSTGAPRSTASQRVRARACQRCRSAALQCGASPVVGKSRPQASGGCRCPA